MGECIAQDKERARNILNKLPKIDKLRIDWCTRSFWVSFINYFSGRTLKECNFLDE